MSNLFHKMHLPDIDPLGGGLAEEIAAEQSDANRMTLDDIDSNELASSWEQIVRDVEKDPEWIRFSEG